MAMEAEKQAAVGRRLKELRGARTQQSLADYVDVTLRAYQAWEAGDSGISWPHIEKLAAYHQVSENFILYGQEGSPVKAQSQLDRMEQQISELHGLLFGNDPELVAGLASRLLRAAGLPPPKADAPAKSPRAVPRRKRA